MPDCRFSIVRHKRREVLEVREGLRGGGRLLAEVSAKVIGEEHIDVLHDDFRFVRGYVCLLDVEVSGLLSRLGSFNGKDTSVVNS